MVRIVSYLSSDLLLSPLELKLCLLSHLYDFIGDLSVALFKLQNFILQLIVIVPQLLNLLRFKLVRRLLFLRLRHPQFFDLQDKFVLLLLKTVDLLNQGHIFLHDLVVLLRVELGVLFKSHGHVLKIRLEMLSFAGIFLVHVAFGRRGSRCRNVGLGHVFFVQTHHELLQLLVIINLAKHFIDVVLKLPLVGLLSNNFLSENFAFPSQTLHFQFKIINDQLQVLPNPLEVLHLLIHFGGLFLQFKNLLSIRLNVLLKFLNFVVKHKLKLL